MQFGTAASLRHTTTAPLPFACQEKRRVVASALSHCAKARAGIDSRQGRTSAHGASRGASVRATHDVHSKYVAHFIAGAWPVARA